MTTYFRKNQKPAALPDVFYLEETNTSYTNLYNLSETELNELGFYLAPDAPIVSDPFYYCVDWSLDDTKWIVLEKNYEQRLSDINSKINDHICQWNKIKRTLELRLITLDYSSESEMTQLQNSILQIRDKIKSLQAITYVDYKKEDSTGNATDRDYNETALNFYCDEPIPSYNSLYE